MTSLNAYYTYFALLSTANEYAVFPNLSSRLIHKEHAVLWEGSVSY